MFLTKTIFNFGLFELDNPFAPSNGYFARLNQGFAGLGGDLNFIKSEYKVSYFKTIAESKLGNVILNMSTKGGYVFGYDNQDVLIGQRFFLAQSVEHFLTIYYIDNVFILLLR